MAVDVNKISASTYTAGMGDLGSQDQTANFGSQVIGGGGNASITLNFTVPKNQALPVIRVNWGGLTYSSLQNYWVKCPGAITFVDSSGHACQLKMSYTRSGNNLAVTVSIGYSSGTCTIPNLAVAVHIRFYELPF